MARRVVITGIGAVTPLGNTFVESWLALLEGKSGIREIEAGRHTGALKGFDPGAYLNPKEIRRLDPFIHYAIAAALMAAEDAGLKGADGVVIGSSRGGISGLEAGMTGKVSAYLMPSTTIGMAASRVAGRLGIRGYCLGISNSCSSGANAIGEAWRLIRDGHMDIMLSGGTEAPLCSLSFEGYGKTGALSGLGIMRPFDRKRDGFILSEGACVLVLEEMKSALKRGAVPYAELAGYGNTVSGHETRPDGESQMTAIKDALKEAGMSPADIGYVNAHATATPEGDRVEAETIEKLFGRKTPLSANKSMTGHMLGASGAFEAGVTAMSLKMGIIPPTINLTEPEFDLNIVLKPAKAKLHAALSTSFGFGGVNAALVVKAFGSDSVK